MTPEFARQKTYNKNPFFGSILFSLGLKEAMEGEIPVDTLATDGMNIYYSRKFWDSLKNDEQMGVLYHEAGHIFLDHIFRGKNLKEMAQDPVTGQVISLFNLAGDAVINLMVKDDPVTDNQGNKAINIPKGGFIDEKYRGWSTEEVYHDLLKQAKKNGKAKGSEGFCDKSKWGKGSAKDRDKLEKKLDNVVKAAAEHAKSQGFEPSYLKRYFEMREPKEDWRILLRDYAMRFQNDYSFNPADRRYLEEDFVLPDIEDGEKIDWIAVACDTSGSIGQAEINAFVSELKGIMDSYDKVKVKVTFCDADATPFQELEEFEPAKLNVQGGGGTSFIPVFKLIEKEDTKPRCLLYFTDLAGDFPSKAPQDYDVLWIATAEGTVPFGKVLKYKV